MQNPQKLTCNEDPPSRRVLKSNVLLYLLSFVISMGVFIPFIVFGRAVRVGDGSEYYAMSIAWADTHRPYLTDTGWLYYDQLYRSNAIPGIENTEALRTFAPDLVANGKQDLSHFWVYSFGAALLMEVGDYAGIEIPIHNAFLLWHCLLFTLLLVIAVHEFGYRGLIAALVLTFLSPVFWYLDKVHTEFFTFSLTTGAVILFVKRNYLLSAFLLAITATQNISFSAISLFVLGTAFYVKQGAKWKPTEWLLCCGVVLVNALHPLYYLIRLGTSSPQFLSGGAKVGVNLSSFLVWFFDPDIGLLPNWWFGVLILFIAFLFAARQKFIFPSSRLLFLFTLVYLLVSLLAQSSTVNLNSGASPGPSRYVTWYLALFFPPLLLLLSSAVKSHLGIVIVTVVLISAAYTSINRFLPSQYGAGHCQPSMSSYWIQRNVSWLYNPPPEIFAERYGGLCEAIDAQKNAAIIAPDCRKVLLLNTHPGLPFTITGASGCNLDFHRISSLIETKFISGTWVVDKPYHNLTRNEVENNLFEPVPGADYHFSFGNSLIQGIGKNFLEWGLPEDWGIWTVGKSSSMVIPCPKEDTSVNQLQLTVTPFVNDVQDSVSVTLQVNRQPAWSGSLDDTRTLTLTLPSDSCKLDTSMFMRISVDNPVSRAALGISGDNRPLGVGLLSIRYINQ